MSNSDTNDHQVPVTIAGTGSYLPEKILTNDELSTMVDTSNEWITSRTGIKERRIAAEGEFTSHMATKAAEKALEQAGIPASEVGLIIVATITPDTLTPATACYVQKNLGCLLWLSLRDETGEEPHLRRRLPKCVDHRRGEAFLLRELGRSQYLRALR